MRTMITKKMKIMKRTKMNTGLFITIATLS